MPEILYSHRSVKDLEKISDYLKEKEHDPLPFLQELKERIELLAHQPLMGVPCVNTRDQKGVPYLLYRQLSDRLPIQQEGKKHFQPQYFPPIGQLPGQSIKRES